MKISTIVIVAGFFVLCSAQGETPANATEPSTTTSTVPSTEKTTSTTVPPETTTTPTTTEKPTTTSKPTEKPTTSTVPPSTSTATPSTSTESPPSPVRPSHWSTTSFIGGMVFAFGMSAIAFVTLKFYKARNERNYHTL